MSALIGRPTRATLLFAFAFCLSVGQLAGWTWLNLRQSAKERHDVLQARAHQAHLAEELLSLRMQDGLALGMLQAQAGQRAQDELAPLFPQLSFAHGERVGPRVDAALEVEHVFRQRVRLFVGQGAALLGVVLAGAWLTMRAMRREQALAHQTANFLAAVTHELRSPLTSLQLWLQTLALRPPTPEALAQALAIMQADIDRLDRLIDNVLNASRREESPARGRQAGGKRPLTDLCAACAEATAALTAQARQKGVVLAWQRPQAPLWAAISAADAQLVLRNLLDNAIKYSGQPARGAQVAITLAQVGSEVEIQVHDTGVGLAKHDVQRVFERFVRVGDEMVRQSTGTGLGLYLVRATAVEHGGRAWATSAGLGLGSAFFVRLPHCAPATTEAMA